MAMTRATMVTQVGEMTGRSDKDSEIAVYLNWGQIKVARAHTFSYMVKEKYMTTTDGTETEAFPSTMKSFYSLRVQTSGYKRKLINRTTRTKDIRVPYPGGEFEGCPIFYNPWGRSFELSPIPDAAYTIYLRCEVWPTDMATGDASDLLNMDDMLCEYGAWQLAKSLNLEKETARFRGEFGSSLAKVIKVDTKDIGGEEQLIAQPFADGSLMLAPGEASDYWKKASFIRSPM